MVSARRVVPSRRAVALRAVACFSIALVVVMRAVVSCRRSSRRAVVRRVVPSSAASYRRPKYGVLRQNVRYIVPSRRRVAPSPVASSVVSSVASCTTRRTFLLSLEYHSKIIDEPTNNQWVYVFCFWHNELRVEFWQVQKDQGASPEWSLSASTVMYGTYSVYAYRFVHYVCNGYNGVFG